jgi:hypothetical protein
MFVFVPLRYSLKWLLSYLLLLLSVRIWPITCPLPLSQMLSSRRQVYAHFAPYVKKITTLFAYFSIKQLSAMPP